MRLQRHLVLVLVAAVAVLVLAGAVLSDEPRSNAPQDAPAGPSAETVSSAEPKACIGHLGRLRYLRVHDVGTGFGPPENFLDVEVVISFDTAPAEYYGFQLRENSNSLVRQGMLDLLRDAYDNNWSVRVDECDGVIFRVWLTK